MKNMSSLDLKLVLPKESVGFLTFLSGRVLNMMDLDGWETYKLLKIMSF